MQKIYQLKAEVECELWRNGQKVFSHAQPCQSFTKWFKLFLADFLTGVGTKGFSNVPIKCVDGSVRKISNWYDDYPYIYYTHCVQNIAIGTSDAGFNYTQYELQSKLMDATGLTKSIDVSDWDTSVRYELTGTFQINTEADIKETGLYGMIRAEGRVNAVFLASRDILSTPIHVVPGDVLIVRYRVTIS
jgi:hypothetical protein